MGLIYLWFYYNEDCDREDDVVKVKIVLVHVMKAYGCSGIVTPHILNLDDK